MKRCLLPCGLVAFVSLTAFGPAAFGQTPAFEVASIHDGAPFSMERLRSGGIGMKINASRVVISSWALTDIIGAAYGVRVDQISGPDWMGSRRFDIQATIPENATAAQVPEMLQALLRDRFKMVARRSQKIMPVYALTVGKGGPKMKESAPEDTTPSGCTPGGGGPRVCHRMSMQDLATMLTSLSRMNAAMPAGSMSWGIDMPAVNLTGLKGVYDFSMSFGPGAPEYGGGSVIDAVERLGLKLESQKRPYDVISVDEIEKVPTGN